MQYHCPICHCSEIRTSTDTGNRLEQVSIEGTMQVADINHDIYPEIILTCGNGCHITTRGQKSAARLLELITTPQPLETLADRAQKLTPVEVLDISIKAGIHNADGSLTVAYCGSW